jgi:hypothetical protein
MPVLIHGFLVVAHLLSVAKSLEHTNDVSIGRRAINAIRATAPICPPHERDPLHVQRSPPCWHGCTASRTGEPGITMVRHFFSPDFLFPRRNPYCYYVQFFVNTQKRQAPFLTTMTATKQARAQDHRFQAQSLPSWTEMSVHSKEGPDPGKPEPQQVAPRSLRTIST